MNHQDQLDIWNRLTPAQRDYDRLVAGRIPRGASWAPETDGGIKLQEEQEQEREKDGYAFESCSCHIVAPCTYCVLRTDDEL